MPAKNDIVKKTSIGGQALIEGLMMIGPYKRAMAVRQPDGQIALEFLKAPAPMKLEGWPVFRGSIKLVRQMILGVQAMLRSADLSEVLRDEEEEGSAETKDETTKEKPPFFERHPETFMLLTTFLALGMSIALFGLLPNLVTDGLRRLFGIGESPEKSLQFLLTLLEGVIRVLIFVGYLWITRQNKEIARVWQYHGSEHKTIACYEAGEELTVDNVARHSRLHPRCGTSFMFLVMMVSILVFATVGWYGPWLNLLLRVLLLPLIAGLSYELIRLAGRYDTPLMRAMSKPGLALQHLTTAEPDAEMIEVAIVAMEAVIPDDESDTW